MKSVCAEFHAIEFQIWFSAQMHLHLQKDHCQPVLTLTVGEGEKNTYTHNTLPDWLSGELIESAALVLFMSKKLQVWSVNQSGSGQKNIMLIALGKPPPQKKGWKNINKSGKEKLNYLLYSCEYKTKTILNTDVFRRDDANSCTLKNCKVTVKGNFHG